MRISVILSENGLADLTLYDLDEDICYLANVYEDESAVLTLTDDGSGPNRLGPRSF